MEEALSSQIGKQLYSQRSIQVVFNISSDPLHVDLAQARTTSAIPWHQHVFCNQARGKRFSHRAKLEQALILVEATHRFQHGPCKIEEPWIGADEGVTLQVS